MSDTNNLADVKKQGKGKKMLLMLAVIFVLPFTIAATLHFLDIRPGGKSFGSLITPPVTLDIPALNKVVQDETFSPEHWEKIWSIVMIDDANCTVSCQESVDKLNRVHISLAKEAKRVQRILLLKGNVEKVEIAALQAKYEGLIVLTGDDQHQLDFINTFTNLAPIGSVYLVDPLNNLMMHYPKEVPSKELRSDLVRLLKNSWNG